MMRFVLKIIKGSLLIPLFCAGCFSATVSPIALPVIVDPRIAGDRTEVAEDNINDIRRMLTDRNGNVSGSAECRPDFRIIDFIDSFPLHGENYSSILYKECNHDPVGVDAGLAFLKAGRLVEYVDMSDVPLPQRIFRIPDINKNGVEEIGILFLEKSEKEEKNYALRVYEIQDNALKKIGDYPAISLKHEDLKNENATLIQFDGDKILQLQSSDPVENLPIDVEWQKVQLLPPDKKDSRNDYYVWPLQNPSNNDESISEE